MEPGLEKHSDKHATKGNISTILQVICQQPLNCFVHVINQTSFLRKHRSCQVNSVHNLRLTLASNCYSYCYSIYLLGRMKLRTVITVRANLMNGLFPGTTFSWVLLTHTLTNRLTNILTHSMFTISWWVARLVTENNRTYVLKTIGCILTNYIPIDIRMYIHCYHIRTNLIINLTFSHSGPR